MTKPTVIEKFTDNGEHSHWELVDCEGDVLWTGEQTNYDSDIIENSEVLFSLANSIEYFIKEQREIGKGLMYNISEVSEIIDTDFSIEAEEGEVLSMRDFFMLKNKKYKKLCKEYFITKKELLLLEKYVLLNKINDDVFEIIFKLIMFLFHAQNEFKIRSDLFLNMPKQTK